jgi:hypothetical protein
MVPGGQYPEYVAAEYAATQDAYLQYDSFRWQLGGLLIAEWHDWVSPDVPYITLCPGLPLHPTDRPAFQGVCAPGSFSRDTHPNTTAGCGPTRTQTSAGKC